MYSNEWKEKPKAETNYIDNCLQGIHRLQSLISLGSEILES